MSAAFPTSCLQVVANVFVLALSFCGKLGHMGCQCQGMVRFAAPSCIQAIAAGASVTERASHVQGLNVSVHVMHVM